MGFYYEVLGFSWDFIRNYYDFVTFLIGFKASMGLPWQSYGGSQEVLGSPRKSKSPGCSHSSRLAGCLELRLVKSQLSKSGGVLLFGGFASRWAYGSTLLAQPLREGRSRPRGWLAGPGASVSL